MKKRIICALAFAGAVSMSMVAAEATSVVKVENLPYSEGCLYISATQDGKQLLAKKVEIDSPTVTVAFDTPPTADKEIALQAFQDLNGNGSLDFDSYGRPTEPCLRITLPVASDGRYTIELQQY